MWQIIPMPYRILAAGLAFLLWSGFMIYGGWHECSIREQAKQRNQALAYAEAVKAEQARGNELSGKLSVAETKITTLTIERTRHVPQVTTGRDCLSAAAVRLLNSNAANGLSKPAGEPAEESPTAPSATDTDIEYWAIQAQGDYDICAARLNALIDWESGR